MSNPRFDFSNKHVLVTGGTSGIGKAIANAFSDAGAQVTAAGLPEFDVTDPNSIATLMARVNELDILVNAAGVIRRDEEFQPDVFAQVLDINLTGAMRMCTGRPAASVTSREARSSTSPPC